MRFFISVLGVLALSACMKERVIERQAPIDTRDSFNTENQSIKACEKGNDCIRLKKASFGKIFLLMSSGRTTGSLPQWVDQKPQLVSFEKSGNRIALLEENYQSIYEDIKASELVQSFEVVGEDADSVVFRWGQGLKTFIIESPYDIHRPKTREDRGGGRGDIANANRRFYPVVDAYTQKAAISDDRLQINQVVKVRYEEDGGGSNDQNKKRFVETSFNMDFQIMPYELSKGFEKRASDPSRKVGYFVTRVNRKGFMGDPDIFANHWDITRPITIAITKSAPAKYVGAITEGALYWNKVLGREVFQVVPDVDPASPPKDRTIIIRWISWMDGTAAYAMIQADPLTGEILRGQVFLSAVFGKVSAGHLVRANNGKLPALMAQVALSCDFADGDDLTQMAVLGSQIDGKIRTAEEKTDESKSLRLARDSIRFVVAHELGHTLGLRHNFAGSFNSTVLAKDVDTAIGNYLETPDYPGLETTTTVMDYLSGVDLTLVSPRLKVAGLSYDKMAIDYAYKGILPTSLAPGVPQPFYCSDEDIEMASKKGKEIYGCQRFDSGKNPVHRAFKDSLFAKENFIKTTLVSILEQLYPADSSEPGRPLDAIISEIRENHSFPSNFVSGMMAINKALFDIRKGGKTASQYISLEIYSMVADSLNMEGLSDPFLKNTLENHLKEAGDLEKILKDLTLYSGVLDTGSVERQINEMTTPNFPKKGKTFGGRDYELSESDVTKIRNFFEELKKKNGPYVQSVVSGTLFPAKGVSDRSGESYDVVLREQFRLPNVTLLPDGYISIWLGAAEQKKSYTIGERNYAVTVAAQPIHLRRSILPFSSLGFVGDKSQQFGPQTKAAIVGLLDQMFADFGSPPPGTKSAAGYEARLTALDTGTPLTPDVRELFNQEISLLKSFEDFSKPPSSAPQG